MSAYERLLQAAERGHLNRTLDRFADLAEAAEGPETAAMDHSTLESFLQGRLRALGQAIYQDALDLRALRETRAEQPPAGADQVARTRAEHGHDRGLETLFGHVTVTRTGYRAPGVRNLYPADAGLNLPAGLHSHGLREMLCREAVRGSYDSAAAAVARATGVTIGKRQALRLVRAADADADAFYAQRRPPAHCLAEPGQATAVPTPPADGSSSPSPPPPAPPSRKSRPSPRPSPSGAPRSPKAPSEAAVNRLVKLVYRTAFGFTDVPNQQRRSRYAASRSTRPEWLHKVTSAPTASVTT